MKSNFQSNNKQTKSLHKLRYHFPFRVTDNYCRIRKLKIVNLFACSGVASIIHRVFMAIIMSARTQGTVESHPLLQTPFQVSKFFSVVHTQGSVLLANSQIDSNKINSKVQNESSLILSVVFCFDLCFVFRVLYFVFRVSCFAFCILYFGVCVFRAL